MMDRHTKTKSKYFDFVSVCFRVPVHHDEGGMALDKIVEVSDKLLECNGQVLLKGLRQRKGSSTLSSTGLITLLRPTGNYPNQPLANPSLTIILLLTTKSFLLFFRQLTTPKICLHKKSPFSTMPISILYFLPKIRKPEYRGCRNIVLYTSPTGCVSVYVGSHPQFLLYYIKDTRIPYPLSDILIPGVNV